MLGKHAEGISHSCQDKSTKSTDGKKIPIRQVTKMEQEGVGYDQKIVQKRDVT